MTSAVALGLRLARRSSMASFERATGDPAAAQAQCLRSILGANGDTAFGRTHGFTGIEDVESFRHRVPLQDYEDLRPWVARMAEGEPGVLAAEAPVMFATTSGTTGEAKLIPVTPSWLARQAALTRRWTLAALADHPRCLGGRILGVVSPTVEGATATGIPLGSMSGLVRDRAPSLVRRRQAVPQSVALVEDLDDRLFLVMRLALARPVAALAMPNATSLLRLAETAEARGEEIVRAVHDGALGVAGARLSPEVRACLGAETRPDRPRALVLARVIEAHGRLVPGACWPGLELVACWLGGSAGVHARRLDVHYGSGVARRDLGLLASKGRMTLPLHDGDAAGVLALDSGFFEFIPEGATASAVPPTLLAHELEDGRCYEVVITGANGLTRYRMHDIVMVQGAYHRTPRLAFLRKGADLVSVTGEKVHLDQVQGALRAAARTGGLDVFQFRLVPNVDACRHDLLVELRGAPPNGARAAALVAGFDRALAATNQEYAAKRASRRLGAPHLFVMAPGCSEERCRAAFESGRREAQHKWSAMGGTWHPADREAVVTVAGEVSAPSP
ncbi:GH3 auxin-responsive promoter family protein [soil metagenome]